MPSSKPSVAELRAACQPAALMRRGSEHWAGRLYMRSLSIYVTRLLVPTRITANGVTWLMIASGLLAAAVITVPALWSAIVGLLLVQLYLLFDCSDGEIARWRRTTGPVGIYLDRVGHYSCEAALLAGLGVRADAGVIGGWTTLGLLGAVLVLCNKAETDLVHVARSLAGLPVVSDDAATPRPAALRGLRRLAAIVPFHRAIGAVEVTILLVIAAVADTVTGTLLVTRSLTVALVVIAGVVVVGHLVSILASNRLR
jgi:phosphatidylglycerophosphate synthase